MHLTIDQSPRIEDWTDDSVIAFANTEEKAIILTSQLKREALAYLEARNKTEKTAKWLILAGGIFLLVRDHLSQITHLTIDLEFDEGTMKQLRAWLYRKIRLEWEKENIRPRFGRDDIRLGSIGKKHRAHQLAYGIYTGQLQPEEDTRVKRRTLLALFQ